MMSEAKLKISYERTHGSKIYNIFPPCC